LLFPPSSSDSNVAGEYVKTRLVPAREKTEVAGNRYVRCGKISYRKLSTAK
jgi:hypothetical protein